MKDGELVIYYIAATGETLLPIMVKLKFQAFHPV